MIKLYFFFRLLFLIFFYQLQANYTFSQESKNNPPSLINNEEILSNDNKEASKIGISENDQDNELKKLDSIKNVIKNDLLEDEVTKKKVLAQSNKKKEELLRIKRFHFPHEDNFWTLISELWLVKNNSLLKWDIQKPDYGLNVAVKDLFESLGFYEKKIKILIIDTPTITHFGLPSNQNEYIFILSRPFIRTMDLSKIEIALIILEDFFRLEFNYFKNYVAEKNMTDNFGKNFYGKEIDLKPFNKIIDNYSFFIFNKGFSFQQQFEVTQKMNNLLKNNLKLWGIYNQLISKIDNLIKTNTLYGQYNKIYPSPELQLKWMNP